jgi:hypothetical protein
VTSTSPHAACRAGSPTACANSAAITASVSVVSMDSDSVAGGQNGGLDCRRFDRKATHAQVTASTKLTAAAVRKEKKQCQFCPPALKSTSG